MGGGGTKNDPLDCGFLSEYFGEQIALKTATETSCFGVNLMGCRLLLLQVLSRHSWKEPLMTASSMNASVMAVAMLIWSAWHSVGRGEKPLAVAIALAVFSAIRWSRCSLLSSVTFFCRASWILSWSTLLLVGHNLWSSEQ